MTALVAALFELAKVDQSIAAAWQCHLTIGSIPLIKFGTDGQKERGCGHSPPDGGSGHSR